MNHHRDEEHPVTATLDPITTSPTLPAETAALETVVVDLYRNIHKGIRHELFGVTFTAGSIDPSDRESLVAFGGRVHNLTGLLASHAHHEDEFLQPLVEVHTPGFAATILSDHAILDAQMTSLDLLAERAIDAARSERRELVHRLHLGLAEFTSRYLAHQDLEEVDVMPALSAVVGADELAAVEHALVASIPPEEMGPALAIMLPAMNIEDRTEMLSGMQAGAPPEVFAGVCGLAQSVLAPTDWRALATRLGVS
jgi:Hemerythrin HHE cation binding domain